MNQLEGGFSNHRSAKQLVGLGAIVMRHGIAQGIAISGKRGSSADTVLEIHDKWHIGSITKSIRATMVARLVERSVLAWKTTIREA